MLVDPVVTEGFPLWGGYSSLHPPPTPRGAPGPASKPSWSPGRNDLVFWMTSMSREELEIIGDNPEYLTSPLYKLIASQWLLIFEYVKARLSQIEWELEYEPWRTSRGLDETLKKFHPWRRRLPLYKSCIETIMHDLERRNRFASSESWNQTISSFREVLARHEELQQRANQVISVLTAVISIEESKKAMSNARDVTRITYLAFAFVPLSFVASFLSMNTNFPHGGATVYWTYFLLAIPLSCIAVLIAYNWLALGKLWKKILASPSDPRKVVGPLPKT